MLKSKLQSESVYEDYPTVAAYSPSPGMLKKWPALKGVWLVPCQFCGRVHQHGAILPGSGGTALREPHCPHSDSPVGFLLEGRERPAMYVLRYEGEMDDPKIFDDATRRTRAKYKSHYQGFAKRSKARCREARNPLPTWPAAHTAQR